MEGETIGLTVKDITGNNRTVGIEEVGKILIGVQNVIYHIAEMKASAGSVRIAGKRNPVISERTKLYFKETAVSSFVAELQSGTQQEIEDYIHPEETLIGTSIRTFDRILTHISESDEAALKKDFDDPLSMKRILHDIDDMWPGEKATYSLEIRVHSFKGLANPERRETIKSIWEPEVKTVREKLVGFLSEIRVAPKTKESIELMGFLGSLKLHYDEESEEKLKGLLKKVVMADCELNVDETDRIKGVRILDVEPIDKIQIERIVSEDFELPLRKPLEVSIKMEDSYWVLSNEELKIEVLEKDLAEAYEAFNEVFSLLFTEYVKEGGGKKVTPGALAIRDTFLEYVGGK